jgi:hypothetical protein
MKSVPRYKQSYTQPAKLNAKFFIHSFQEAKSNQWIFPVIIATEP